MAENPKIKQITLPGSNSVYDIVDQGARDLISALNSFTYAICTEQKDTPSGISFTSGNTTITGTLAAGANTMNKIYLVPVTRENKTIYNEYITVDKGSGTPRYVWELFGDTDIHLPDFGNLAYKDTASGTLPKLKVTTNVAVNTDTKYVAASATGGGTVTKGTAASCTLPTWSASVSNEVLTISWNGGSWTANTPTAVTLPSFASQTIATGIKTQPAVGYDTTNSSTTITVS